MQRPRRQRISPHPWRTGWLAAGALALLAAPVLVAETPREAPAAEAVPSPGLRAYLDPETGELTDAPSRQQVEDLSQRLERTLSRSSAGLEPFTLARGGRGVYLEHRYQSALIARIRADGGLEISSVKDTGVELSCVADPAAAAALLAAHGASVPEPPKPEWVEK